MTTLWPLNLVDFANSTGPYRASTSGIFQYRPTSADANFHYILGEYESNVLQFANAPPSTQTHSKEWVSKSLTTSIIAKSSLKQCARVHFYLQLKSSEYHQCGWLRLWAVGRCWSQVGPHPAVLSVISHTSVNCAAHSPVARIQRSRSSLERMSAPNLDQ